MRNNDTVERAHNSMYNNFITKLTCSKLCMHKTAKNKNIYRPKIHGDFIVGNHNEPAVFLFQLLDDGFDCIRYQDQYGHVVVVM